MTQFNTPHAHSDMWHVLDNLAAIKLFKKAFGNDITMLPNQYIIEELRIAGTATLELLEDRTASSVYRIRQTGVVYQVENNEGEVFDYDDYDEYQAAKPIDNIVTLYSNGELPNYTVARVDDSTIFVTRNNPPRFSCTYKNGDITMTDIKDTLEPMKLAKLMRGVGTAISRFLKDEQKR